MCSLCVDGDFANLVTIVERGLFGAIFNICFCFVCMSVLPATMYHKEYSAHGGQKRVLGPLKLELGNMGVGN